MGKSLQQEAEELSEAMRDLGYKLVKEMGLIRFAKSRGLKLKPWVEERERRDEQT